MPDPTWDEKGHRRKLVEALAWPDELAEQQGNDVNAGTGALGGGIKDEQWSRAWEEYQKAVAMREAGTPEGETKEP